VNVAAKLDEGLIGADFAIEREEYDVAWGGSGHIDVDPCPDSGPVFALLHVYTAQDSFTLAIRPGPDHREGAAGLLALGDDGGLCAVGRGCAVVGDVHDRSSFTRVVTEFPIVEIRPVPARRLALLNCSRGLALVDASGEVASTGAICWEEIRIDLVTGHDATGIADPLIDARRFKWSFPTRRGEDGRFGWLP